ncbi:MAG: 3-phosphoshikimate 1-carboxyvinyltransferase [Verrucomicrobiota bacterium]
MLPELLTIEPFSKPVAGSVTLPGSKSITNRALILAALSKESLTLEAALFSDDTKIMAAALRAVGVTVSEDEPGKTLFIKGCGGEIPHAEAEIYVGNAGTAARFLTAMLCLRKGGTFKMDGSEAMRKRPMRGLLDALVKLGATDVEYHGREGFFPFTLKTKGIPGGNLSVDASASSQILSALLMVAPLAQAPLTLTLAGETVSHPFIGMTLAMMDQFGIQPKADSDTGPFYFEASPGYYFPRPAYVVEPDATAASYYAILPWVVGGSLALERCYGIGLQGDIRFIDVLGKLGAFFNMDGNNLIAEFKERKTGGITENFNPISDTFLTLAAITPLLDGPTTISGIAHTRHQETDRINAMATELRKLGQKVDETDDSMTVYPDREALIAKTQYSPVTIHTYEDHRVAMSFGIAGSFDLHGDGRPWIALHDPGCCAKTFPNFFDVLASLR